MHLLIWHVLGSEYACVCVLVLKCGVFEPTWLVWYAVLRVFMPHYIL